MMPLIPLLAVVLALNSFPVASGSSLYAVPRTVVITFSGLWNGVDPYANYANPHRPIPSSYQPLLGAEPLTRPVDGGDIGVRIGWDTAQSSNHELNSNVKDHTGDAAPDRKESGHELGGGDMFALQPCAVTFSKPVEIPSLFWTFYEPAKLRVAKNGTIEVFRNISDTTPLKSVEVPYADQKGFVWRKLTAFEGLKVSKIVFDPRGQNTGLNIDDIQIRVSSDE